MNELSVWQKRCDSLNTSLGKLFANLPDDVSSMDTLQTLLQNLRDFGQSHFGFFFEEFKNGTRLRDEDNEFPKAAVLNWITQQISYDIEVITRAWEQRRRTSIYSNDLKLADKLGEIALEPARNCGFIDPNTIVLCYFQKSYSVRLIPYASIALIGLPVTALTVRRDYLAIPHEVAHYVYRHGNLPDGEGKYHAENQAIALYLNNMIEPLFNKTKEDKYLLDWVEEIFADMYGSIIAGPVMAIDFQDLQMDDPLKEFADATIDQEDPVPLLRPDTYVKTLALLGNDQWHTLAQFLHRRWQLYRQKYWGHFKANYGNKFKKHDSANREESTGENRNNIVDLENGIYFLTNEGIKAVDEIRDDTSNLSADKIFDKTIRTIWENIIVKMKNSAPVNTTNSFHWAGDEENLKDLWEYLKDKKAEDFDSLDDLDPLLISLYTKFEETLSKLELEMKNLTPTEVSTNAASESSPLPSEESPVPVWENWKNRFEKRNLLTSWDHKSNRTPMPARIKNETPDDSSPVPERTSRAYGWYELAYVNGWVTRGPEPNPVGG